MSSQPSAAAQVPQPTQQLLQFASGYMVSAALNVVAKLNIADHLTSGPKHVSELAQAAEVREDCLYRVMRALASVGIFREIGLQYFELTPDADALRADAPNSVRNMVLWIADPLHFETWGQMLHCVKTGETATQHLHKKSVFEMFEEDPAEAAVFNHAMTDFSKMASSGLLEAYDFSAINTLCDIAGGHGSVLTSVLQQYPNMRGILFEIDHVAEGARQHIRGEGLDLRCRVESGDFFAAVPHGADTYMLQHIIHDWADEQAIQILRNIRRAIGSNPNGRVLLLEGVICPGNDPDFTKLIDLEMLILAGGHERTEEQFAELLQQSGFRLNRIIPANGPIDVIEALPV